MRAFKPQLPPSPSEGPISIIQSSVTKFHQTWYITSIDHQKSHAEHRIQKQHLAAKVWLFSQLRVGTRWPQDDFPPVWECHGKKGTSSKTRVGREINA